jgi:hypothetical protein
MDPEPMFEYLALDDLSWSIDQAEKLPALADVIKNAPQQQETPFLLLHTLPADQRKVAGLTAIVPERQRSQVDAFAELWSQRFDCTVETFLAEGRVALRCEAKTPTTPKAFDSLISDWLAKWLVSGRPLRGYHCTFMLPLDLCRDDELEAENPLEALQVEDETPGVERYRVQVPESILATNREENPSQKQRDDEAHAQAYEFFHTHLQRQLYETEQEQAELPVKPIRHWRLNAQQTNGMTLELIDEAEDETKRFPPITSVVEEVSLYQYYNGLYLLGLRVAMGEREALSEHFSSLTRDGDDWWHNLLFCTPENLPALRALQAEYWLRFSKLARILFSSFYEQRKENKISPAYLCRNGQCLAERPLKDHFSGILIYLLRCFLPRLTDEELRRQDRLRQVADDRMFVHCAYALSGPEASDDLQRQNAADRLFSYALWVDQHSDGFDAANRWAYDEAFIRKQMQGHVLERWKSISSLSGYTDYSSVYVGTGWFFANVIAPVHIPYIYAKMQILALFFDATLSRFDRRISAATNELIEHRQGTEAFRHLRRDFIQFTNNYWFRSLTPQLQGDEISERMMAARKLQQKYELLKDEMERADEFSAALREEYVNKLVNRGAVVGLLIGATALALQWLDFGDVSNYFPTGRLPSEGKIALGLIGASSLVALITLWPFRPTFLQRKKK